MGEPLALGLVFLLAAFTMSFAGFGSALVAVPLLSLRFPVPVAVALQFPFCLAMFLFQAWHYRTHLRWSEMRPLLLGSALGLVLGTFFLHRLPPVALKRSLALFIVGVVLFEALPQGERLSRRLAHRPWWGRACGFLSGAFFGAYTIGGPPAAIYILSRGSHPLQAKSFLATYFAAQFLLLGGVYITTGLLNWERLLASLPYAPAGVLGAGLGLWAFGRASALAYRRVVRALLLAAAALLWLGAGS